jgi:hypothetical protein
MIEIHKNVKEEVDERPYLAKLIFRVNAEYSSSAADCIIEKIKSASDQKTFHGDSDFSLVVIGTRALGNMSALLLGSIGQRVLRESPVPVIIARSYEIGLASLPSKGFGSSLMVSITGLAKSLSTSSLRKASIDEAAGHSLSASKSKSDMHSTSKLRTVPVFEEN